MKALVLIKQVPDTYTERRMDLETGRVDRAATEPILDEISEKAVEVALQLKESREDTTVTVLTMGPTRAAEAMRRALAMGADDGIHVLDDRLAGSDALQTARALAAAIHDVPYDVLIAGNESTDGRMAAVPAMLAEILALPHLTFLRQLSVEEHRVTGQRIGEDGCLEVEATLPAVVSVTEQIAEARFPNFRGIMAAKKKPLRVMGLDELGIAPEEAGQTAARSQVGSVTARPPRTGGEKFVDDGTGAAKIADFLAAENLI